TTTVFATRDFHHLKHIAEISSEKNQIFHDAAYRAGGTCDSERNLRADCREQIHRTRSHIRRCGRIATARHAGLALRDKRQSSRRTLAVRLRTNRSQWKSGAADSYR